MLQQHSTTCLYVELEGAKGCSVRVGRVRCDVLYMSCDVLGLLCGEWFSVRVGRVRCDVLYMSCDVLGLLCGEWCRVCMVYDAVSGV